VNADEARDKIRRCRNRVEDTREELADLYYERAWETLGYESWGELFAAEFGPDVAAILPREIRRELVGQLTQEGMSKPAIAGALGVARSTVGEDRRASGVGRPANVVGIDGKTYTPAAPPPETDAQREAREARAEADEIRDGYRRSNLYLAESVYRLAGTSLAHLESSWPTHADDVAGPMQVTPGRLDDAIATLETVRKWSHEAARTVD